MRELPLLIVGLGQIGASVALGLKAQGYQAPLAGLDTSPLVGRKARKSGLFSQVEEKPGAFVREYPAILLAVPVETIPLVLVDLEPWLAPGAWVSDVGSVKGPVVEKAKELGGDEQRWFFLGGHPMAGTEKAGWDGAHPQLFAGAYWIFTPTSLHRPSLRFWRYVARRLGARPRLLSPTVHDRMAAFTSHLPYLISLALMDLLAEKIWDTGGWGQRRWRWLTAGSFASATRVAQGDPRMSLEMIHANRLFLKEEVQGFAQKLQDLLDHLERQGLDFRQRVDDLRRWRQDW